MILLFGVHDLKSRFGTFKYLLFCLLRGTGIPTFAFDAMVTSRYKPPYSIVAEDDDVSAVPFEFEPTPGSTPTTRLLRVSDS